MTDLVDAGYNDGNATRRQSGDTPENPTVTRPMKPFSSLSALDAGDLRDSAQEGATDGAHDGNRQT